MPSAEQFVRMRIEGNLPPKRVAQFDPMIAIALAGLVIQLFRACAEQRARKTLMNARRRPNGIAACQLRNQLAASYQKKFPAMDRNDLGEYVESTMKSLHEAEPEELDVLLAEAQDAPPR